MPKVFVTSDTWFNRLLDEDPDLNTVDMNKKIIQSWNKTVSKEDVVYVLGGFGISDLYNVVVRLNGVIHFLDNYFNQNEKQFIDELKLFVMNSNDDVLKSRIIFDDRQIVAVCDLDCILSYFPISNWCGKDSGTYLIHGFDESMSIPDHSVSCVCSKWNYAPVSIDVIKNDIDMFKNMMI